MWRRPAHAGGCAAARQPGSIRPGPPAEWASAGRASPGPTSCRVRVITTTTPRPGTGPGGVRVKPASPSRPPGLDGYGGSAPRRPRTQFPAAGAGDGEHSSESIGKVLFFSSPGPCQLRPEAEVRSWHLFLPLSSTDPSRAVQVAWQLLPHAETIHPVGDPGRGSSVGGASEAPPV